MVRTRGRRRSALHKPVSKRWHSLIKNGLCQLSKTRGWELFTLSLTRDRDENSTRKQQAASAKCAVRPVQCAMWHWLLMHVACPVVWRSFWLLLCCCCLVVLCCVLLRKPPPNAPSRPLLRAPGRAAVTSDALERRATRKMRLRNNANRNRSAQRAPCIASIF